MALGSPTMLRALLLLALCSLAQCYVVGTAPTALRPLARAPAAVTMEEQPFAVFSKIPTPALFATFGGAAMVRARPAQIGSPPRRRLTRDARRSQVAVAAFISSTTGPQASVPYAVVAIALMKVGETLLEGEA